MCRPCKSHSRSFRISTSALPGPQMYFMRKCILRPFINRLSPLGMASISLPTRLPSPPMTAFIHYHVRINLDHTLHVTTTQPYKRACAHGLKHSYNMISSCVSDEVAFLQYNHFYAPAYIVDWRELDCWCVFNMRDGPKAMTRADENRSKEKEKAPAS